MTNFMSDSTTSHSHSSTLLSSSTRVSTSTLRLMVRTMITDQSSSCRAVQHRSQR